MKTFNLFLDTDDTECGDFYSFSESIIGKKAVDEIYKNAPVQSINSQLWKMIVATKGPKVKWRPITRHNGNTLIGVFPADTIIGYLEEDDDEKECLEKLGDLSFMNVLALKDMEAKASRVILSEYSAAEVSRRTGVPKSTVKSIRSKVKDGWLDTNGISIKTLKGLISFEE